MAEIIKAILAAKAGSSPTRGLEPKGLQTGQKAVWGQRSGRLPGPQQLPGGPTQIRQQVLSHCQGWVSGWVKVLMAHDGLYVRSRSAEPTHRERPAHIPRDHLMCSLDYFPLSLSQHLQLVSSTYFHALPSLFSQDVSGTADTYSYSLILVITSIKYLTLRALLVFISQYCLSSFL